ncbi:MAG: hypothetical protein O7B26_12095 [Planctomycetota bacterium]|nr:hypothetical protein [Planctomycetota bacterium]
MLATTTYGLWAPPLYSAHGGSIDSLIDVVHYFMILTFIPWCVFFVYCLYRFRQRPGHKADYHPVKAKVSQYAEYAIVIIEAFLLVGLSMPVWADYKNEPPDEGKRTEIRVVAQQFQWNVHYPGADGVFGRTDAALVDEASNPIGLDKDSDPDAADDVVTQEFHFPVGKDIYIRLTSKDVIHSFAIPTMRVKQDVIPGMEIPIWFKVDENATTDKLLKQMTERFPTAKANWYKLRHYVAAEDITSKTGEVMLAKGEGLGFTLDDGNKLLEKLSKAGIAELTLHPIHPMEVVCAQLCGNSHFKMKSKVLTHTPEDYLAWMVEEGAPEDEVEF